MIVVGILLELLIVALVQYFQFLLNRGSLSPTYRARARVLLLLLHLLEHGVLLNLQQVLALVLAQAQPVFLYVLALLL